MGRPSCPSSSPGQHVATERSGSCRRSSGTEHFTRRKALGHLVEYRWLIVEEVERQAGEVGVNVLRVDGMGIDETLASVEALFADALERGPRAETDGERQALLRYANEAIVTQARGYLARPGSTGDEATFLREFLWRGAMTPSAPRSSRSWWRTTRPAYRHTPDAGRDRVSP